MKFSVGEFIAIGVLGVVSGSILTLDLSKPTTSTDRTYPDSSIIAVNVRGEEWGIYIAKSGDKTDALLRSAGYTAMTICDDDHQIFMVSGLNYFLQREAVVHELLHAATCHDNKTHNDYFNSGNENVHPGFDRISSFTISLFHDNPELAHYIIGR